MHLWPEKAKNAEGEKALNQRLLEVTMKMAQIPAGPSQAQVSAIMYGDGGRHCSFCVESLSLYAVGKKVSLIE